VFLSSNLVLHVFDESSKGMKPPNNGIKFVQELPKSTVNILLFDFKNSSFSSAFKKNDKQTEEFATTIDPNRRSFQRMSRNYMTVKHSYDVDYTDLSRVWLSPPMEKSRGMNDVLYDIMCASVIRAYVASYYSFDFTKETFLCDVLPQLWIDSTQVVEEEEIAIVVDTFKQLIKHNSKSSVNDSITLQAKVVPLSQKSEKMKKVDDKAEPLADFVVRGDDDESSEEVEPDKPLIKSSATVEKTDKLPSAQGNAPASLGVLTVQGAVGRPKGKKVEPGVVPGQPKMPIPKKSESVPGKPAHNNQTPLTENSNKWRKKQKAMEKENPPAGGGGGNGPGGGSNDNDNDINDVLPAVDSGGFGGFQQ